MKNLVQKLSSMALAVVLLVALCVPAFAASTGVGTQVEVTPGATATVVVGVGAADDEETANGGDTLEAYQVVSIMYDADHNTVDYSFTDAFNAFRTDTEWGTLTPKGYGDLKTADLEKLLGAFTAYVKDDAHTVTPDRSAEDSDGDGIVTFARMNMGQYIIVGAGTSNGAKIYQTVTAEVEPKSTDGGAYMLYPTYNVSMKTSKPSVDKGITDGTVPDGEKKTASIGDVIDYKLTVAIPTYPDGAANTTFFLGDTLSKGLDLNAGSITVTANDGMELKVDSDYTVRSFKAEGSQTKLYIDFTFEKIAAYTTVTVTYKATLNRDAELGTITGNANDVDLIYSNSPFNGNTWEPGNPETPDEPDRPGPSTPGYGQDTDKETVYTYALAIDKFDAADTGSKLEGAEFALYAADGTTAILDENDKAVVLTTDENGVVFYEGLEAGTYYLKETKAPNGFNLVPDLIKVTIDSNNIAYMKTTRGTITYYTYTTDVIGDQAILYGELVWMNAAGEIATGAQPDGYKAAYVKSTETKTIAENSEIIVDADGSADGSANGYYMVGVANSTGAQLPSTGGVGTTIFYIVGGVLAVGAAILLITKRRMNGAQD